MDHWSNGTPTLQISTTDLKLLQFETINTCCKYKNAALTLYSLLCCCRQIISPIIHRIIVAFFSRNNFSFAAVMSASVYGACCFLELFILEFSCYKMKCSIFWTLELAHLQNMMHDNITLAVFSMSMSTLRYLVLCLLETNLCRIKLKIYLHTTLVKEKSTILIMPYPRWPNMLLVLVPWIWYWITQSNGGHPF